MIGKVPPPLLKVDDEILVKWLNEVRNWAVQGSIAHLGPGFQATPGANGWSIGLDVSGLVSGVYFCQTPSSGLAGATGTWPTLTAASFTADVYQTVGTAITKIASSATIYNWFPATPATSKVTMVFPDGSGAYVVGPQSCT